MATAEKYDPQPIKPPQRVKLDLSVQEATNLYTLLVDGVDPETRLRLGLDDVVKALSNVQITRNWLTEFSYQAEI